jgi:hypothetical protein
MSDSSCPIIVQDGVAMLVGAGYEKYSAFASQAWSMAIAELGKLGNFQVSTINPNVTFNIDQSVYGFNRPTAPTLPDLTFNDPGSIPAAPNLIATPVSFTDAPAEPANLVPSLPEYAQPDAALGAAPADLPSVQPTAFSTDALSVSVAPQPVLTLPDVPAPDLLPAFTQPSPPAIPSPPSASFSFTPAEYTSSLLTQIQGKLGDVIADDSAMLPAPVVQALRDRANASVDVEELRQVEEVYDDFAARGFEQPPGMLLRRVDQVRQRAQDQRGSLNRDIYVQEQTVALENLKFAISTGVSLEATLIGAHNDFMRIGMESARLAEDIGLQLFSAQVAFYNGQMQANAIFASIQRDRAASVLELARLQLEAQKSRGELTEQQWTDGLRGLEAQAEAARVNLAAQQAEAAAKNEDNRTALDRFRAELAGFGEQRAAFTTQWENWSRKWQTNDTRARVAELATENYATRIRAWSETQQGQIAQANLGIAINDQSMRAWRGQVDVVLAKYTAERDRLASLTAIAGAQVDLFRAEVGVETAAADANLRLLLAGLQREQDRVNVALKNAELSIQQMIENGKLLLSAQDGIARTSSQLAASSMSAVNFSAGLRSSLSQDYGCRTSFSYSGQIDPST